MKRSQERKKNNWEEGKSRDSNHENMKEEGYIVVYYKIASYKTYSLILDSTIRAITITLHPGG